MAKKLSLTNRKSLRHKFGVLADTVDMPNLIEIQRESYEQFLTSKAKETKKSDIGIEDALKSIFPVKDYAGRMSLKYISYKLERPKYDVLECRQRGLSYAAALKVTFRLDIVNIDQETGSQIGQDAREEEARVSLASTKRFRPSKQKQLLTPSSRLLMFSITRRTVPKRSMRIWASSRRPRARSALSEW